MPSRALTGLTKRLSDLDEIELAHKAVGGVAKGRRWKTASLNRASVLLLCGHFEGFVEDLVKEGVKAVHAQLEGKPIIAKFHNPWPKAIDETFAVFGLSSVTKRVSWRNAGNKAVLRNLNELVETRNGIAHGKRGVSVTLADVKRLRRYVEGASKQLDSRLRTRIRVMTGVAPW